MSESNTSCSNNNLKAPTAVRAPPARLDSFLASASGDEYSEAELPRSDKRLDDLIAKKDKAVQLIRDSNKMRRQSMIIKAKILLN